ncbi:MAG: glycosyltransferase family 39 protein [Pseudomonadota bacterium]
MMSKAAPALWACATTLGVALILSIFHDQFWWPVDEGVYAYVAQRANAGDILNRDLIDLHAGYGNLINAWAFRLFGEDLLSLRYPLVAMAAVQAALAFALLRGEGNATACLAALIITAFSFVQFPNPSANWHALFWCFALIWLLRRGPDMSTRQLLAIGLIVGLCFFTRQLSGVHLAFGAVCTLLIAAPRMEGANRWPALAAAALPLLILTVYLISKGHLFGGLWAGAAPLSLLAIAAWSARITWGFAARVTGLLVAGFGLAALPVVAYGLWNGSLGFWLRDIFVSAFAINNQAFIADAQFLDQILSSVAIALSGHSLAASASGIAWILLILSVPGLGALTTLRLARLQPVPPVATVAVFWAVGALHYQIPIYLLFVLPPVLLALLVLKPRLPMLGLGAALAVWTLVFQVGQPLERGLTGTLAGIRTEPNSPANLPRVSLRIQAADQAMYTELLAAIEGGAGPDEPLMTLPMNPELNFMTGRVSPTRYYGSPFGLLEASDVDESLARLQDAAPLWVVVRTGDKYLTPLTLELLAEVRRRSAEPHRIGPFELYRFQETAHLAASQPAQ